MVTSVKDEKLCQKQIKFLRCDGKLKRLTIFFLKKKKSATDDFKKDVNRVNFYSMLTSVYVQ